MPFLIEKSSQEACDQGTSPGQWYGFQEGSVSLSLFLAKYTEAYSLFQTSLLTYEATENYCILVHVSSVSEAEEILISPFLFISY